MQHQTIRLCVCVCVCTENSVCVCYKAHIHIAWFCMHCFGRISCDVICECFLFAVARFCACTCQWCRRLQKRHFAHALFEKLKRVKQRMLRAKRLLLQVIHDTTWTENIYKGMVWVESFEKQIIFFDMNFKSHKKLKQIN